MAVNIGDRRCDQSNQMRRCRRGIAPHTRSVGPCDSLESGQQGLLTVAGIGLHLAQQQPSQR